MWNRGLIAVVILGLASVYGLWWWQNRALTSTESLLFSKLQKASSHSPPRAEDVISAFDLPGACREKTCWLEEGSIGGLSYSEGDLRQPEEGLIFVLEGFFNKCVRAQRASARFDLKPPQQSCPHGGCWYAEAQHDWGILAFGLDEPNSECVASVVINTLPYQRTKPSTD